MTKVDEAVFTLCRLAVSPSRQSITELDLQIHEIPTPEKQKIEVPLKEFLVYAGKIPAEQFYSKLRAGKQTATPASDIVIHQKTHSECELVARLMGTDATIPGLIPYVACSKLHCLPCHLWLGNFSEKVRLVGFGGSHGGVKPGWMPPVFPTGNFDSIPLKMVKQLNSILADSQHRKEDSASSTSDPATSFSRPFTNASKDEVEGRSF